MWNFSILINRDLAKNALKHVNKLVFHSTLDLVDSVLQWCECEPIDGVSMFAITGCHVAVRGTYVTRLHLHQNTTTMSVFNVTVIQVHQNTTTMSVFNVTVIQVH